MTAVRPATMNDRLDTTYAGLLNRLSDGGYLTASERTRLPGILAASAEVQSHATHELLRRLVRQNRLALHQGSLDHPGAAITAADERRGLLFVLPALRFRERGVLHPPLDPLLGPPPSLNSDEALQLFDHLGGDLFNSAPPAGDLRSMVVDILDQLRVLLQAPAALCSGRGLPLPGGIARGPRELVLGGGQASPEARSPHSPDAGTPPDSAPGLPAAWEHWMRRAAERSTEAVYLFDFQELDPPLPARRGSALLVPIFSTDPVWDAVLAAVAPHPYWFDEERVARARLLRNHAQSALAYAVRLQGLISVDFLTGVYNRSFFVDQFMRTMAGAMRKHQSFALLILDIDDFRGFNSRHGYDAGDAVLRSIAQVLKRTLRTTDVLARYGGEEFAVILAPPVTSAEARQIGERLRAAVESLPVMVPTLAGERQQVAVTVSIGGALFPSDGRVRDELWNQANQMLLQAKSTGKNRVRFPDSATPAQDEEA
ncbi:MAG: GGDEF domain-containing protein [Candidatus Eisenbacteria bacterium]